MFQYPRRTSPAGEGSAEGELLEFPPLVSSPGGDPDELAFLRVSDWQPVPAGYDWYGRVDPEGLMDGSDPFSRTPASAAPGEVQ